MIIKLLLMIAYFIVCNILFPIVAWFSPIIPRWYVFVLAFSTVTSAFGYPGRIPVYNQPLYMRKYGWALSLFENGLLLIGLIWMIYSAVTSIMELF